MSPHRIRHNPTNTPRYLAGQAGFRWSTQAGTARRGQGTNRFWKSGEMGAAAVVPRSSHHRSSPWEEAQTARHLCKLSSRGPCSADRGKRIAARAVSLVSIW